MTTRNPDFKWHQVLDEDNSVVRVMGTLATIAEQDELHGLDNYTQIMDSENQHTVKLNCSGREVMWAVGLLDLPRVMSSDDLAAFFATEQVNTDYKDLIQATKLEEVGLVTHMIGLISPLKQPLTLDHYGYKDADAREAGDALRESMDHALYEGSAEMVEAFLKHDTVIRTLLDSPAEHAAKISEHPHLKARIHEGLTFPKTIDGELISHRMDCLDARMAEYRVGKTEGRKTIKNEIRAIAASLAIEGSAALTQPQHITAINRLIDSALHMGMGNETDDRPIKFLDTEKSLNDLCDVKLPVLSRVNGGVGKREPRSGLDRRMLAEAMLATAVSVVGLQNVQYKDLAAAQHAASSRGTLDLDCRPEMKDEMKAILIAMDKIDETSWTYCGESGLMARLAEHIQDDDSVDSQWIEQTVMKLQTAPQENSNFHLLELHETLDLDSAPAFASPRN